MKIDWKQIGIKDLAALISEDPIEFIFPSSQSCIIQRELGIDMESFGGALKAAMRQDIITLDEAKRISRSTDLERKLMYY